MGAQGLSAQAQGCWVPLLPTSAVGEGDLRAQSGPSADPLPPASIHATMGLSPLRLSLSLFLSKRSLGLISAC